jgi:hypothetical protein
MARVHAIGKGIPVRTSTEVISRILLTVLIASFLSGLAWWAYAGLPWLSLTLLITGLAILFWLWWPVYTGKVKTRK